LDGIGMSEVSTHTNDGIVPSITIECHQSNKPVMAQEPPPILLVSHIPPRSPRPTPTG
jgi:hypothetical protein